ncbi:MAG: TRAM domain-containing protein, partial [Clostridia bacterium]|nr:TRAM domain-containing protein [Clostridia bacterium]
MLQKNDEFELKITGCTAEGSGVGRKDGETVFVENAAPGDVVLAHVIKAKKTYAVAKTVRVLTPSPDRVTPAC